LGEEKTYEFSYCIHFISIPNSRMKASLQFFVDRLSTTHCCCCC
jgi:hypothetical protein